MTACVTGASGLIGRRIVAHLLRCGHGVRVLSRNWQQALGPVKVFEGDILEPDVVDRFVNGADTIFHCAAELRDEHRMWEVNVEGTRGLLGAARRHRAGCFLHLSSVGVVGSTRAKLVDEETLCSPQNSYDRSKWAAEQLVMGSTSTARIVCLRPTNVIARERAGAMKIPMRGSLGDRVRRFVQGGENMHIVHAHNVAAAAIHVAELPLERPEVFIVSSDHEPLNTLSGLWSSYMDVRNGSTIGSSRRFTTLPIMIPFVLRRLVRGRGNRGDVVYSSKKLFSTGFTFPLDWSECMKDIVLRPEDSRLGQELRLGTSCPPDHGAP